jgi:hypothetical protein
LLLKQHILHQGQKNNVPAAALASHSEIKVL